MILKQNKLRGLDAKFLAHFCIDVSKIMHRISVLNVNLGSIMPIKLLVYSIKHLR